MADQDRRHIDRKAEEDKQAFIQASVDASNAEAVKQASLPQEQPAAPAKGK